MSSSGPGAPVESGLPGEVSEVHERVARLARELAIRQGRLPLDEEDEDEDEDVLPQLAPDNWDTLTTEQQNAHIRLLRDGVEDIPEGQEGRQSCKAHDCGRPLTAPESIYRGYGPDCAKKNGWPYDHDRAH